MDRNLKGERSMKGFKFFKLAMLFLMGGLLALYGSTNAAGAAEPIKIGFVGIMTGPNALNGEYCSEGAKLAVEEINAWGGIRPAGEVQTRPVELIVEDDGGTPQIGVNAINKLLYEHKVFAFLGPDYSSITFPSMFLAQQAGVVQITSSLAPKITAQGNPWIFRSRPSDAVGAAVIADYFVKELKLKKIALSYTNIEYGISGIEEAEKNFAKFSIQPILKVSHAAGDRDLTPPATKIIESKAEGVIDWGLQTEASILFRQLIQMGYKGKLFYSSLDDIFIGVAKEFSEGVLGISNYVYTDERPAAQKLRKAFLAKFKKEPDLHSGAYYDGVYILKEAIEKAGLDRMKVRDFIHHLKGFRKATGVFNYDMNGDCGHFQCVTVARGLKIFILKRYGY
jgi:branched-chain amino acid transport system substrate-binding protein